MKTLSFGVCLIVSLLSISLFGQETQPVEPAFKKLDDVFGFSGKLQPGGVYRFGWPRTDLRVSVGDINVESRLALGSWAAFRKSRANDLMAMGDLVLLHTEVNLVIKELQSGGLHIHAIHNHLIGETPQIMYVHFMGHGAASQLASALKTALGKTKTPVHSQSASNPMKPSAAHLEIFDTIQKTMGRQGQITENVLQINVARKETILMNGEEIPPSMGMAMLFNFQIAGSQVATTGDFVLLADEVNPVIKELQRNGIEITALHSHMLHETPRLFFMHFWALDSPEKISSGLKAALSHVKTK